MLMITPRQARQFAHLARVRPDLGAEYERHIAAYLAALEPDVQTSEARALNAIKTRGRAVVNFEKR